MALNTLADYQQEIARVQAALDKTESEHLRRDYSKYLKRLHRQMRSYIQFRKEAMK